MLESSRKKSKSIKYLKTISKTDSSKYILRGNDQSSIFECKEDRECVMYGGIEADKETRDMFQFSSKSNNYTIKDFRKGKESDQITIPIADKDAIYPNNNVSIGSEPTLEIDQWGDNLEVRIEGYTKSEIRGWVDVAKNPWKYDQNKIDKNSIIISK